MGTIGDKLTYLTGTKTAIKNALVDKGITVGDNDTFRSYAQKISNYTSDADATANDILEGKTAYVNGQKLTGSCAPISDYFETNFPAGVSGQTGLAKTIKKIPDNMITNSNMSYMFASCTALTTIPLLDTSNVTNMSYMLLGCTSLTTIPLLDTSNVTNISGMFNNCTSLTTIPLLDTSNVTNMSGMFHNCTALTDIPLLDTSNVTNMSGMFTSCTKLTSAPILNTEKVNTTERMFMNCAKLIEAPLLDTSRVTSMKEMFYGCTRLTTIPVFNTSRVTNFSAMLQNCSNLSDESLNNLMQMCINATSYTGTKKLTVFQITPAQRTRCASLSNYQAFLNAGWVII